MKKKYPALVTQGFPLEIELSNSLLESLMEISKIESLLLEGLKKPLELKLLRKARVRAITYSNQIEGNQLTESEVTAILDGKKVAGREKDILEIKNYQKAVDYVELLAADKRPMTLSDYLGIQRLVTEGTINKKYSGSLRAIEVSIINSETNEVIDRCPEPHLLKALVDELWLWFEANQHQNPFVLAFSFHLLSVFIHPFADGNGRTSRLLQHYVLMKNKKSVVQLIPSETSIMKYRDDYYKSIRLSKSLSKPTPFLEFLAKCFYESCKDILDESKSIEKKSLKANERQKIIMKFAKKKKTFVVSDLESLLDQVSRRTIERDLSQLSEEGQLQPSGKNKGRVYCVKVYT